MQRESDKRHSQPGRPALPRGRANSASSRNNQTLLVGMQRQQFMPYLAFESGGRQFPCLWQEAMSRRSNPLNCVERPKPASPGNCVVLAFGPARYVTTHMRIARVRAVDRRHLQLGGGRHWFQSTCAFGLKTLTKLNSGKQCG